jgi:hypothetical protein
MIETIFDASDFEQLGRAISRLPGDIKTKAMARAMTRLRQRARTEVVNRNAEHTQMPKGRIRKLTTARFNAGGNTQEVTVKSGWIGLYALGARQTRTGVTVRGRGKYDHAFLATMKSGHRGVFIRDYPGEKGKKAKIMELYGANPAHAITNNPDVYLEVLADLIEKELAPRFLHELDRILPR